MVINNLYINGAPALELKTNPPLIVNANAPLSLTFALQSFKSVTRRHSQVLYPFGNVQQRKLTHRDDLNTDEPPNAFAGKHSFRIPAFKGYDHDK
jgi:hypothetical protein